MCIRDRYTARVHEHLHSRVRAVYMARVYECVVVYWPCTRPCIWRVQGLVTAVYTYACIRVRSYGSYGSYAAVYVPCTGTRAVYTARAQYVTAIFFAKDTFYAETYSYKSITFRKS